MTLDNTSFHIAKAKKNDEFYTQLTDIENELYHYRKHFENKIVYCNCDDPTVSNFFHYFSHQFETLKLKKIIATCYKNQQMSLFSKHDSKRAIYLEYNGDKNDNRVPDINEIDVIPLKEDGDFRSKECVDLLKQADIVVTNPPFSLFREYVAQLIECHKKFLIIGNKNAISYKEIFPLIKDNKIWLGYTSKGGMSFMKKTQVNINGKIDNKIDLVSIGAVWFTNLDYDKRHEDIILYKKYSESEYPKYDNYDAINVNKTKEIPMDYDGVMGVPITFMNQYNPDQFEILGLSRYFKHGYDHCEDLAVSGKDVYMRIMIKHKRFKK